MTEKTSIWAQLIPGRVKKISCSLREKISDRLSLHMIVSGIAWPGRGHEPRGTDTVFEPRGEAQGTEEAKLPRQSEVRTCAAPSSSIRGRSEAALRGERLVDLLVTFVSTVSLHERVALRPQQHPQGTRKALAR